MRINKITSINTKRVQCKLVAACPLINSEGKYLQGATVFFDYMDGILRQYASSDHTDHEFSSFRDALKHIQSL